MNQIDLGYVNLAYAIVEQAVVDYKKCMSTGKPTAHLVRFFNSTWCDVLLEMSNLNGRYILSKLKSMDYPKHKKYKKRP